MCKKSESIKEIAVALAKFNAEVRSVEKDAKNPHFKNEYATLDNIINEVKPLLAKHGLVFMQMPGGDGERFTMTTLLMHTSGEWIESDPIVMRPVKNDPQGIGSCSTYARRYSLSAFLGIATGDDDDGNDASQPQKPAHTAQQTQSHQPSTPRTQATTSQAGASINAISSAQIGLVKKLLLEKKISDDNYRIILDGYGVASSKDLTKQQASKLIEQLTAYVPIQEMEEEPLPF